MATPAERSELDSAYLDILALVEAVWRNDDPAQHAIMDAAEGEHGGEMLKAAVYLLIVSLTNLPDPHGWVHKMRHGALREFGERSDGA